MGRRRGKGHEWTGRLGECGTEERKDGTVGGWIGSEG